FSVAGLWSKWKDPDGQTLKTFTVITQAANRLMKDIHDRMPAILTQEAERLWTDPDLSAKDALQLLVPFPAEEMQAYRVSDRINKVANNDAGLIEKFSNVDKPGNIQGTLF
ncbi:MAG TPA: SOS response-associated peptidase family protein, partial [Saprospiraceae bacterium]|nr:SOS response-associated peptidase family protein [Saprospiraceae bacterium]